MILVSIQEDDWQFLILRFFARIGSTRRKNLWLRSGSDNQDAGLDHRPGIPPARNGQILFSPFAGSVIIWPFQ